MGRRLLLVVWLSEVIVVMEVVTSALGIVTVIVEVHLSFFETFVVMTPVAFNGRLAFTGMRPASCSSW